ncbi:transcription factor IIIC subunit delta N-term-domain-containing protein [Gloeopeniophorella convolvens]|nr:transcription factor IIIC subunit delta N-term-domain-containing protein [Gloeopeniophorella convolvens]
MTDSRAKSTIGALSPSRRHMEHVTVYTALSVPAAASHPTISCLQWTEDGQLLFATKAAVYILTPDLGVGYGSPAVSKGSRHRDGGPYSNAHGWFRTILEPDRRTFHHWPNDSQEWDSLVTGSLDISIKSIAASPSFLTAEAGCVLAIISTNLELSLWCSLKDQLAGQWVQLQDATPFLKSLAVMKEDSHLQQTLQAQVLCSSWSRQPDLGGAPSVICDNSLLALGNKAGSVLLLRFTDEHETGRHLEHVRTVDICEQWITHLTWLPWTRIGPNQSEAFLVYGASDGSVGLVKVTRAHRAGSNDASYPGTLIPTTDVALLKSSICDFEDRDITGLACIGLPNTRPVVVILRPGVVQLWKETHTNNLWSGLRSFALRRQCILRGSSALYPTSGLLYAPKHDAIVLSLFDGSFHAIYGISTSPAVDALQDSQPSLGLSSSDLSSMSRTVFLQTEGGTVPHAEMNRISGMTSFGDFPTVAWTHEKSTPSDFSYKHEAKHNSTLVVARLGDDESDDDVLKMVTKIISEAKAFSGIAPIYALYPLLFCLGRDGVLTRLHSRLLLDLRSSVEDGSAAITTAPLPSNPSSDNHQWFCESITNHLFGSDSLLQLRLKLATADFCWRSATGKDVQGEFGALAQVLLSAISHRVLRALVRHVDLVAHSLTQDDTPFVLRVVIQCMLPGAPPELSAEAQNLANKITASYPTGSDAPGSLQEKCPACGVEVPLDDITTAVCSNKHRWARCSITSFILSTTKVRTCLGCRRKAFLPPVQLRNQEEGEQDQMMDVDASGDSAAEAPGSERLSPAECGWVVKELLKAVRRCLFCGNRFVTLI